MIVTFAKTQTYLCSVMANNRGEMTKLTWEHQLVLMNVQDDCQTWVEDDCQSNSVHHDHNYPHNWLLTLTLFGQVLGKY